jgi:hypothetical protein
MQRVDECFVYVKDGEWFCRAPCEFDGPAGRVTCTPGVTYRRGRPHQGVDVAATLDECKATGHIPPNYSFF